MPDGRVRHISPLPVICLVLHNRNCSVAWSLQGAERCATRSRKTQPFDDVGATAKLTTTVVDWLGSVQCPAYLSSSLVMDPIFHRDYPRRWSGARPRARHC